MYYLAIVGSREFTNERIFNSEVDDYIFNNFRHLPLTIVSGGARGTDSLAREYAIRKKMPLIEYYPNWTIGKHAAFLRNRQIIEKADHVMAFLIDSLPCNGTKNSISIAKELDKITKIITFHKG